ncbi:type I-E CRISPR-associated protein Cas7/Cse4/CasC [Saccharopolyspora sp. NPDC047091]|uniref:type I-E CRISPR-associated protein Cas7/Cse4/CasC n=1 Tax=Saccharopolyspora sp. NPDC047091 TaxID=3155924 RepID=UPI0033C82083
MTAPAYLDIHVLQALPFSNVNRDDLGAPKTVVFGGAERTRISSQSWKRVIRKHVEEQLGERTVRTRRVVRGVAERLQAQGWAEEEAYAAGIQVAVSAGKGISLQPDKDDNDSLVLTTNVLLLLPESGIDELAQLAAGHRDAILAESKRAKKATEVKAKLPNEDVAEILSRRSGTINLFGRMLAELPGANVDGAVQVAHAFTTHGTQVEYDFFTAVDDVEEQLNLTGSGHLNTAMFSAGTFYRYANINLTDLVGENNLAGNTDAAAALVSAFLDGFLNKLPTGKQNSTAPMTPADLVHIAVRDDRPASLANAFEAPVWGRRGHLVESVNRLIEQSRTVTRLLGEDHVLHAGYTATAAALAEGQATEIQLGTRYESFDELIRVAVTNAYPGARP